MALPVPNKLDFHVNLSQPATSSNITGPLANNPAQKTSITQNDILTLRFFFYTVDPATLTLTNQTLPTGTQVAFGAILASDRSSLSISTTASTLTTAADVVTPDYPSGLQCYQGTLDLAGSGPAGLIATALTDVTQVDILANIQLSDSASSPTKRATVGWFLASLLYDAFTAS